MSAHRVPTVLSIAGTDPIGGAGIQADLKSIAANGGYGMAVVTALLAQNQHGVRAVHVPPAAFLEAQLSSVEDAVVIDAVKIGMVGAPELFDAVALWLAEVSPPIVVVDPVMATSSGHPLLDPGSHDGLGRVLNLADLVTPNLGELAALLGEPVATSWPDALEQGRRLSARHGLTTLVKGGHLQGDRSPDALVDAGGVLVEVDFPRIKTRSGRGTGCSLSSAIATRRAGLGDWPGALLAARSWLQDALQHAEPAGIPALHHFHRLWSEAAPTVDRPP